MVLGHPSEEIHLKVFQLYPGFAAQFFYFEAEIFRNTPEIFYFNLQFGDIGPRLRRLNLQFPYFDIQFGDVGPGLRHIALYRLDFFNEPKFGFAEISLGG